MKRVILLMLLVLFFIQSNGQNCKANYCFSAQIDDTSKMLVVTFFNLSQPIDSIKSILWLFNDGQEDRTHFTKGHL